jgi:LPPG:FO 2-phospho-L-lactate transferase
MEKYDFRKLRVVALAGGVGGAKLADGLARLLPPKNLTIIANTADDFEHLGLCISPDLDTLWYTLAGIANPATGWGRVGESWHALETVGKLGGPTWFRLGDHDIGLHLERTRRLRQGQPLSQITLHFCKALGIDARILPMSDDTIRTWVYTSEGELSFQEYFVHRQCHPRVTGFRFEGVENASPAPGVLESLSTADLVVFCPSNPWVSIDPILAISGMRQAVRAHPVVAVSPIIGGLAVKGPAAKMYSELGIQPSSLSVARHYSGLLNGIVIDHVDAVQADAIKESGVRTCVADIMMKTVQDRIRLVEEVIGFAVNIIES